MHPTSGMAQRLLQMSPLRFRTHREPDRESACRDRRRTGFPGLAPARQPVWLLIRWTADDCQHR